jgi:predicted nuclease of predicted toxin-antitoxin system
MLPNPNWAFLIDENADFRLKRDLHAGGFTAVHVHATDVGLGGFPDTVVFAYAKAHQLILLTIDQDFLNTQHYPPPHPGIVVARLRNARTFRQEVVAGILTLARRLPQLTNTVQIIDPGGVVQQVYPSGTPIP